MSPSKDIYWMSSPLAMGQRAEWNSSAKKLCKPLTRVLDPAKERHFFRKIQHWTIEIDGKCYELAPDPDRKSRRYKFTTDMCKPHTVDAKHWHGIRATHGIVPERRRVGQTERSRAEIEAIVRRIWIEFNHDRYGLFTQNCQNFAQMLFLHVATAVSYTESQQWERIPEPVGRRLAQVSRVSLGGRAVLGTHSAYIAAVGAMETTAATGGPGVIVTHASMAAQTMHGTATTIATTAKGAMVTTTTAGHAGLTSAAGVGHGIIQGAGAKVAMIGSGMAKAGAIAAYAHPVSGVMLTGGMVYMAVRGRRSRKLKDRQALGNDEFEMHEEEKVGGMVAAEEPEADAELSMIALLRVEEELMDELERSERLMVQRGVDPSEYQ